MTQHCENGFAAFELPKLLLTNLQKIGFLAPKPIQEQTIPAQLAGHDLLAIAQTGSGKTAAFCLPMIAKLLKQGKKRQAKTCAALVLVPTRELAVQIEQELRRFIVGAHLSVAVVFGGVGRGKQVKRLQDGVDFLVATPGRLLDLVSSRDIDLSHTQFLVLDEADRMLDMGFVGDIRRISKFLPKAHQTAFFSATMPKEIVKLSADFLRDPIRFGEEKQGTVTTLIEQLVYQVPQADKKYVICDLLDQMDFRSVIIFARTKYGADGLGRALAKFGYRLEVIHGNKSQNARVKALQAFRDGKLRILIATDIAARGIDISRIDLVINYDLPDDADNYVHRIGRTGRNEAKGVAVTLYDPTKEHAKLRAIERVTKVKFDIVKKEVSTRKKPCSVVHPDELTQEVVKKPFQEKRRFRTKKTKPFAAQGRNPDKKKQLRSR